LVSTDNLEATAVIFPLTERLANAEVSPSPVGSENEFAIELTDIKNTSARVAKVVFIFFIVLCFYSLARCFLIALFVFMTVMILKSYSNIC
jgi:hypothetical protein